MMNTDRIHAAEELMNEFAARTGIATPGMLGDRYLWTDAFAVFNFLGLYKLTGKEMHLNRALYLVDQVHHILGRHREDDPRTGWISGLSDRDGDRHPVCGGLRIGKRLNERGPDEPYDDQLEWDRDGQYFHYLTKWMHALNRVSLITGDSLYNDWALELADAAHHAFVYHPSTDGRSRMYWKMSIDLSRPLVPSMGQLDPLDGFVTFSRLQATRNESAHPHGSDLSRAREEMKAMCVGGAWTTGDELGIGGLLADAGQLVRLIAEGHLSDLMILDKVLADTQRSLRSFEAHHRLDDPVEARLAFREIGLSIGLQTLDPIRDSILQHTSRFHNSKVLLARIDGISRYSRLIERIEDFWLDPMNQRAITWTSHLDINAVMLVTSLVPQIYLLGDRDMFIDGNPLQPIRTSVRETH